MENLSKQGFIPPLRVEGVHRERVRDPSFNGVKGPRIWSIDPMDKGVTGPS